MKSDSKVLRVDDVFKIYSAGGEDTVALRGASLEIGQGEFVALLGRSGSGKSTLLNVMSGLDTPSAGRVYLDGKDIAP
jgi:putative ABC transport system ATP-binding protein